MPEISLTLLLHEAARHHQAGAYHEAEQLYRHVLALRPGQLQATHNLGVLLLTCGQIQLAKELFHGATQANPHDPTCHHLLGMALVRSNEIDAAIVAFSRALELKSDFAQARYNLGQARRSQGNHAQALADFREAISLEPSNPDFHNDLGLTLRDIGQFDESLAAFHQSISLRPDHAETYVNLGNTLRACGRLDEAIVAYQRAIHLKPGLSAAYSNLGVVLDESGQASQAAGALQRAIDLNPGNALAHHNLANILYRMAEPIAAIGMYERAISLSANYAESYAGLALALREIGKMDQAVSTCQKAISLKPDLAEARTILGNIYMDTACIDDAISCYGEAIALNPADVKAHSNLLFAMHFHPNCDGQAIYEEHRKWNQRFAAGFGNSIIPHMNDRSPERRLRIGYVSPDFRNHPVGRFILPLMSNHNESQVELFAYSLTTAADSLTQQIRARAHHWRELAGTSDDQTAGIIRNDKIDVLVDLAMHTNNNRLLIFARKPAPVQFTYLAYCSTTGLGAIDYRLSDPHLDPHDADDAIYSEQTVRLPSTYWCYEPATNAPVSALPIQKNTHLTFGCLNNFSKVTSEWVGACGKILQIVPHGRLILNAPEGSCRDRIAQLLQKYDIDPKRIKFTGRLPYDQYLQLFSEIDVCLDTFPFGGGTTTCDSLWMGVPVVTLRGRTAVGRGGASILSNLGLTDFIASDLGHFVQIAVRSANDIEGLGKLRRTIRERMQGAPLMNSRIFAQSLEAAYRETWVKWCGSS